MAKQRNHTFDFLCGICIIRMMCNHAISMCGLRNDKILGITWYELMSWTFFFMCFFFFKAGYFNKTKKASSNTDIKEEANNNATTTTKVYIIDKIKRLLVPYISWTIIGSSIYFGFILLFPYIHNSQMPSFSWDHLWKTSHAYGNGPVWFLMSFFTAYIVIHFIQKVRWIKWTIFLYPFISYWLYTIDSPLPLSLDNVFLGIFFFFLGRVWKVFMQWLGRTRTIIISSVLIILFIIGNIYFHGEYTMSTNTWDGNIWGIIINTTSILCGLAGLLMSLPLPRIPWINYIGEHSMVYFVSHYPMIYFMMLTYKAGYVDWKHNWAICIIMMIVLFIACSWLVPYVERVPWLSGRWKKSV